MGHVVAETTSWVHPQKGSLTVVIGNGPVYNAGNVHFHRQAQFFVNQDSVLVQQKAMQVTPAGAPAPQLDVSRWPQAKVFDSYQEFPQAWKGSPRTTTDFSAGNADIFKGQDTYGWPPDPDPPYFSP